MPPGRDRWKRDAPARSDDLAVEQPGEGRLGNHGILQVARETEELHGRAGPDDLPVDRSHDQGHGRPRLEVHRPGLVRPHVEAVADLDAESPVAFAHGKLRQVERGLGLRAGREENPADAVAAGFEAVRQRPAVGIGGAPGHDLFALGRPLRGPRGTQNLDRGRRVGNVPGGQLLVVVEHGDAPDARDRGDQLVKDGRGEPRVAEAVGRVGPGLEPAHVEQPAAGAVQLEEVVALRVVNGSGRRFGQRDEEGGSQLDRVVGQDASGDLEIGTSRRGLAAARRRRSALRAAVEVGAGTER